MLRRAADIFFFFAATLRRCLRYNFFLCLMIIAAGAADFITPAMPRVDVLPR